jgi:DNA invertase Pin-like site-specific DNA recombinase
LKAAIYARVSTKDQSAENQVLELRRHCSAMGYQIQGEYIDQVSGGRSDRPAFIQMMDDAHKRKFDLLLFWSLDRFTREGAMKTIHYLQRLESYGIQFKSYTESYLDSTGIFKEAIIALMATLAKQEKVRLSERVKAGLDRARSQGRIGGRKAIDNHLQQQIMQLKANSLSNRQIARKLKITHKTVGKYLLIT